MTLGKAPDAAGYAFLPELIAASRETADMMKMLSARAQSTASLLHAAADTIGAMR
jgi:hypothetical protein